MGYLYARAGRTDSIALVRLMELRFKFLTVELKQDSGQTAGAMWRDYQRGGRHDKPGFLRELLPSNAPLHRVSDSRIPKRQGRHQAA